MLNLLTIAGSDSCGGAGIQADIKTFCAHGCYGMSIITAVTAQNGQGVSDAVDIPPKMIMAQADAVFSDIRVDAVKTGMLSCTETIKCVADILRKYSPKFYVLDPVMISKSGFALLKEEAIASIIKLLLPLCSVVTPNIPEAEAISGLKIDSECDAKKAAEKIYSFGPKNVLIKGGHLIGEPIDLLYDGKKFTSFHGHRIHTKNTHGTGCTLSAAIACNLAGGKNICEAVRLSKEYVTTGIEHSLDIGAGCGPLHHFYDLYSKQ